MEEHKEYIEIFIAELNKLGLNHNYSEALGYLRDNTTDPPCYDKHFITKNNKFLMFTILRRKVAEVVSESQLDKPFPYSNLKYEGLKIKILDEKERSRLEEFVKSYEVGLNDKAIILN